MSNGIHDKHRERVRDEFLANGFTLDTPPHKILEMLLFYSIPRKDTNEIAHRLLQQFGTIEEVLDANENDLLEIDGIGKNTVAFLKLIKFTTNFYMNEKHKVAKSYTNIYDICEVVVDKYVGLTKEKVGVTSLGNSGEILGFDFVAEGDVSQVGIPVRKVIETIVKRNAVAIVLSHNHPHGFSMPSKADVYFTEILKETLDHLDVEFLDHVVICDNDYITLRTSVDYAYVFNDKKSKTDSTSRFYEVAK